jgi:hygromycin-B 7''-O-kinase
MDTVQLERETRAGMPELESLRAYRASYHDEALWLPAARMICEHAGFPADGLERGPDGTHVVYFVSDEVVLKVFSPLFGADIVAETLVTPLVDGRVSVRTPSVIERGELDGWQYLFLTRVPGVPADAVWSELSGRELTALAGDVGRLIADVRKLPTAGLEALALEWDTFVASQLDRVPERDAPEGLAVGPEDVAAFMETVPPGRLTGAAGVLLLADITDEHVLLSRGHPRRLVGLVDFGDAFVGHPDYDLVAPGLTIARGDRDVLRTLLAAAGYELGHEAAALRRGLMAQTLVHRYATLLDCVKAVPGAAGAVTLDELSMRLWPVD